MCVSSLVTFTSFFCITFTVLQKPCQGHYGKFQEFGENRFGSSEKDLRGFKIGKWQHKLVRHYKSGNLISHFLHNAAKTCLFGLKISENVEIEHVLQSKAIFHLSCNIHTSCYNAFNQVDKRSVLSRGFVAFLVRSSRFIIYKHWSQTT